MSIVVPVYNVAKYIEQALESIVAQSFTDFEVLLIDDGSTDGSAEICDRYADKDTRFRVYHRANSGAAASRNFGIDKSHGDFIIFMDSDDYLSSNMLAGMVSAMTSKEDAAICGFSKVSSTLTETHSELPLPSDGQATTITPAEALEDMFYERLINCTPWAKLFHHSLLEGIRFPPIRIGEDQAVMYRILGRATSVARVDIPYYQYRIHDESVSRTCSPEERILALSPSESAVQYSRINYPSIESAAVHKLFLETVYILQDFGIRNAMTDRKDYKKCRDAIKRTRRTVLSDRKAPLRHRIYAAVSYIGCWPLALSGNLLPLVSVARKKVSRS